MIMDAYTPPFEITNSMVDRISSIMKSIGKLDSYEDFSKMPYLRRNGRIRSVHSSLAIEANSLTFEQVQDVIDGKTVTGPENEIQEVKNAYEAYGMIREIDPYSVQDLKKIHGVMTRRTVKESGCFRKGNEGVFDENGNCIRVCPPPEFIDGLMKQLFAWMRKNRDVINPLILSSVFHYEFVFIHPFADGNGRTARLWQNALLADWEGIFEYLPIESQIKKYQTDYYTAINNSNRSGSSTEFVEFMLKMIDGTLLEAVRSSALQERHKSLYINRLLEVMVPGVQLTTSEMMRELGLKSRASFRKNYLLPAIESGLIKMTEPDKPTSRNQMYYTEINRGD